MSVERPVAGIILAAGLASRMGGAKVLLPWRERPLVQHIAQVALASRLHESLVVTGHLHAEVASVLAELPVRVVHNPEYRTGLSSSIRVGVAALPEDIAGALILLADQPLLTAPILDSLLDAYWRTGAPIVSAFAGGRRGNPVLFDRALFPRLLALDGDQGARRIVDAHLDELCRVEVDESVFADVDTPEAYARLVAVAGAR